MISVSKIAGIIRDRIVPIGCDRIQNNAQVIRKGVGVGRGGIALAEDGIGQLTEAAGDVDPGRSRTRRIGHVVDAVRGDGVGVVATAVGIRDDLLNRRRSRAGGQAGGDIRPVAASILRDVNLAGSGTDINEFAEVAYP